MSQGNAAWNSDALLFTIHAMDHPIDAIGDLMDLPTGPAVNQASPRASPELDALVLKLNDGISRNIQNKPRVADALAAGDERRAAELNSIDEAIGSDRSDLEEEILKFPIRSIGEPTWPIISTITGRCRTTRRSPWLMAF